MAQTPLIAGSLHDHVVVGRQLADRMTDLNTDISGWLSNYLRKVANTEGGLQNGHCVQTGNEQDASEMITAAKFQTFATELANFLGNITEDFKNAVAVVTVGGGKIH